MVAANHPNAAIDRVNLCVCLTVINNQIMIARQMIVRIIASLNDFYAISISVLLSPMLTVQHWRNGRVLGLSRN